MNAAPLIPKLHVEGVDDRSIISDLLARHGVDTNRGNQFLLIQSMSNDDGVLDAMAEAIKLSTDRPVGFVLDIDRETQNRWEAVCARLREAGANPPPECPEGGYLDQLPDYPCRFGVWMMPDCVTDFGKIEHLLQSLIPDGDPLWGFARQCVADAAALIDSLNKQLGSGAAKWDRYRDVDRIKAELHTWLSLKSKPGVPFGAAINYHIFTDNSPVAIAFLRWIRELYEFPQLAHL